MYVFLDFEASSLSKASYPIELAWVFEDGRSESHLIRPAEQWSDWRADAEEIHHISQSRLQAEGTPYEQVAVRMVSELSGHELFSSAPSWDGKWLSLLLRTSGLPRHALQLRDTEEAQRSIAAKLLAPVVPPNLLDNIVQDIVVRAAVEERQPVRHRALADAEQERQLWLRVRRLAEQRRAQLIGAASD